MIITRSHLNYKLFTQMQINELHEAKALIKKQIDSYVPSISGVCISDQERQREYWDAYKNIQCILSMKETKGNQHGK